MGFFTPYVHKSGNNKKYWLHSKKRGKTDIYYFSKDALDAIMNIPRGFKVVENPLTGLAFLKKEAKGRGRHPTEKKSSEKGGK